VYSKLLTKIKSELPEFIMESQLDLLEDVKKVDLLSHYSCFR